MSKDFQTGRDAADFAYKPPAPDNMPQGMSIGKYIPAVPASQSNQPQIKPRITLGDEG